MNNSLSLTFILTPLLLVIWLSGCGESDELRYPDAPVIDLVYNDETFTNFYPGILASENLPYETVLNWQVTVNGYLLNTDSDRFVGQANTTWYMGTTKRYVELSFPKVLTEYTANTWLDLGIPTADKKNTPLAIARSVTIDLHPFEGEGGPYNVGIGTLTMESTLMPDAAQWWASP